VVETELYLIRHGETDWSRAHRYTGRTDLALTAAGREECRRTRATLFELAGSEAVFDRVYASPMARAVQTAECIFGPQCPVEVSDLLREIDFGDLEGLTLAEQEATCPDASVWRHGGRNGETLEEVGRRADAFLGTCVGERDRVVVVSHGYIMRIIAARALGLQPHHGALFAMSTGSVGLVADVRGRRVVAAWNLPARSG